MPYFHVLCVLCIDFSLLASSFLIFCYPVSLGLKATACFRRWATHIGTFGGVNWTCDFNILKVLHRNRFKTLKSTSLNTDSQTF